MKVHRISNAALLSRYTVQVPLLAASLLLLQCHHKENLDRDQASAVHAEMLRLRTAPMADKPARIDHLRHLPCHHYLVCTARDTCADAFSHHVKGWQIGQQLEAEMNGAPKAPPAAASRLLQMRDEVAVARKRLDDCDRAMRAMNHAFRLP